MIDDFVKEKSMRNKCFNTGMNTGYFKRRKEETEVTYWRNNESVTEINCTDMLMSDDL